MELTITAGIAIAAVSFAAEYVDSSLGMGYGTTLTPVLLLIGFAPLRWCPPCSCPSCSPACYPASCTTPWATST